MGNGRMMTRNPVCFLIRLIYLIEMLLVFGTPIGCVDEPKIKISPDIAGTWMIDSKFRLDLIYTISLDPKGTSGTLDVESSGKSLRMLKFAGLEDSMSIKIIGAQREPYNDSEKHSFNDFLDILKLADPPAKLHFSHSVSGTAFADSKADLFISGFFASNLSMPLKKISENERISLPFQNVKLDVDLQVPSGVEAKFDSDSGPWGNAGLSFVKPVHPLGQVKSIYINETLLPLASTQIVNGMVCTKNFGEFEILFLGAGEGKTDFRATRTQIKAVRTWLDNSRKTPKQDN